MMAMMMFSTTPSRFLGATISDHVKKGKTKFLLAGAFLLMAVGVTAFLLSQTLATLYVFLILWGFGSGTLTPLDIVIRGRYFGRKAYGSIQGSSVIFSAPLSFLAPIYVGRVYDVTGNYTSAFILFAILAASAAVLVCLIRIPKPPAHTSDIRRIV
jgi:MFS family permease